MVTHRAPHLRLTVSTLNQSYPIFIGEQLSVRQLLLPLIKSNKIFIVSDDNVADRHFATLLQQLTGFELASYILPAGEENKNISHWQAILQAMIEADLHRDSTVIAFGGGVIGDMAGFAASCYQRGISVIQVPTTLLAQVDSSVGGKTAVNFYQEKNVIGSFYQPDGVLIELDYLKTLPKREYLAGLAEVIKYALIGDSQFFNWLEEHAEPILALSAPHLTHLIQRCCQMKADIVSQDEKENGVRALLNLGHTFGHALEALTHYQTYRHGEAVAIGLYLQALLAEQLSPNSNHVANRVQAILSKFALPYQLPEHINLAQMVKLMYRDKKIVGSVMRFVITKQIGDAQLIDIADEGIIMQVLKHATK